MDILKKILRYSLITILTIAILYWVFKDADFEFILNAALKANYMWIGLSLLMATTGFYIRALRWKLIINGTNFYPSTKNTFLSVLIAYFANILLPRFGEIARCGTLGKKEKIPIDTLLGTVVLERVFDVCMLFILMVFTAIYKWDVFGVFFLDTLQNWMLILLKNKMFLYSVAGAGVLVFLILLVFRKKIKTLKIYLKIKTFIIGFIQGLLAIKSIPKKKLFLLYTASIWIFYWFMTWFMFYSIEATSQLKAIDGLFILIAGGIGMSVPVQNGFGTFHGIIASALTIYGFDFQKEGLLFAVLCHESQTLLIIVLGFIALIMLSKKQVKHENN